MGLFSSPKRKKKSIDAQIRKAKRQLEHKKKKAQLETLKKQLRGF